MMGPIKSTDTFSVLRNRDASASIRGFVYQADITILRWIELRNDEVLELERGEDIDRVARTALDANSNPERLLEQIKTSRSKVSLRSIAIATALANFYEHSQANTGTRIVFRFTTNAAVAPERPTGRVTRSKGIELWRQLSDLLPGPLAEPEHSARAAIVERLKELLTKSRKPKRFSADTWNAWMQFLRISPVDEFINFVKRIEILTSFKPPEFMEASIRVQLVSAGLVANQEQAREAYDRLFRFVLKLLTRVGLKRIGRLELEEEIRSVGESPDRRDTVNLKFILNTIRGLDTRLTILEATAERLLPTTSFADGGTKTFAPTQTYFGKRLVAEQTFNHCSAIVGRDEHLDRLTAAIKLALSEARILIIPITALPSRGKSRLLLEIARRMHPIVQAMWVRDGQRIDATSQSEIQQGPLLLLCDDAQKRDDLGVLFEFLRHRKDGAVVCLAARPYGAGIIREAVFRGGLLEEQVLPFEELPDVDPSLILPRLREVLGGEYQQLAEQIVRCSNGSFAVALVSAILVRKRQLAPRVVAFDQEFQTMTMQSFKKELLESIDPTVSATLSQKLLATLSVVQPLEWEHSEIEQNLAEFVRAPLSELRRAKVSLVHAGIVQVEQSGARIVPDVLCDHVRDHALFAAHVPTGFEDEVLDVFGDEVLMNLLRNYAELDWQRTMVGRPILTFDAMWSSFVRKLMSQPNYTRMHWLKQLQSVSAFQPEKVVGLCEELRRDGGASEISNHPWRMKTTRAAVLAALPELLAIAAHQYGNTEKAIDQMWALVVDDLRDDPHAANQAFSQLESTLNYNVERPTWMQESGLAALKRWTVSSTWHDREHSPLFIARNIFKMSMTSQTYNEKNRTVTMARHGVHSQNTMPLRIKTLEVLEHLIHARPMPIPGFALDAVLVSLEPPEEIFAHQNTPFEESLFEEQYRKSLDLLEKLTESDLDPILTISLARKLPALARRSLLDWKKDRIAAIERSLIESPICRLLRSLGQSYRTDPRFDLSYDARRAAIAAADALVVEELTEQNATADEISYALAEACTSLTSVRQQLDVAPLLSVFACAHPQLAALVALWAIRQDEFPSISTENWVVPICSQLRAVLPHDYESILNHAFGNSAFTVRRACARLLSSVAYHATGWNSNEFSHVRMLLADSDAGVRREMIHGLAWADLTQANALYGDVVLRSDAPSAARLADSWQMRTDGSAPSLSEPVAIHLLNELVPIKALDADNGGLSLLISSIARKYPFRVVDFLCKRADYFDERVNSEVEDEWLARHYEVVPFRGIDGLQEALRESGEYEALVLRAFEIGAQGTAHALNPSAREQIASVLVSQWDADVEALVRTWMRDHSWDKLRRLVGFFLATQREFSRSNEIFVGELLAVTGALEPELYAILAQALQVGALRGDHAVRSVGEVDPVTARLAAHGANAATRFLSAGNLFAANFYAALADSAGEMLEAERERDSRRLNG